MEVISSVLSNAVPTPHERQQNTPNAPRSLFQLAPWNATMCRRHWIDSSFHDPGSAIKMIHIPLTIQTLVDLSGGSLKHWQNDKQVDQDSILPSPK